MPSTTVPALFQPIQVGDTKLSHRVVLAPLTRLRADSAHVPTDMVQEYYVQRARVPGTLLISEATFIAPEAGGMPHAPGIWNFEQIAAWKKVSSRRADAGKSGLTILCRNRSRRQSTQRARTSTSSSGHWGAPRVPPR